jgi:hypothetical protein
MTRNQCMYWKLLSAKLAFLELPSLTAGLSGFLNYQTLDSRNFAIPVYPCCPDNIQLWYLWMKYTKILAWEQNTKVDPKYKPNYISLTRSFPLEEILFHFLDLNFLHRECCITIIKISLHHNCSAGHFRYVQYKCYCWRLKVILNITTNVTNGKLGYTSIFINPHASYKK